MFDLDNSIAALRKGGVIAYPTEGVWGVGCDPRDEAATMRLLALKQREVAKGLILIASGESQLAPFIDMAALDATALDAVRASWPGANTWIVPASNDAPAWITGEHDGIAVRVVSMPSTTVFDRQSVKYKSEVLPAGVPRIAVEAGVTDFWWKYGCAAVIGIDTYGESAPAGVLFQHFGFTTDNVVATVRKVLGK